MSAIDFKTILQGFRDALKDDAAIEAWCQDEFDTSITVFVGMDEGNPPGEDDFPLVVIGADLQSVRGEEQGTYSHTIPVDFSILWESAASQPAVTSNVKEFEGLYKMSELGQLIWTALGTASSNVALSLAEYDIDPLSQFPILIGGFNVTINTPHVLGGSVTF